MHVIMTKNSFAQRTISRRRFINTAGALATATMLPVSLWGKGRRASEVQIGAISYSFRSIPGSAEEILAYMQQLKLPTIELMGAPAEQYAGAPQGPPFRGDFRQLSEEERAKMVKARQKAQEEAKKWRLSASMDKFEELGQMYREGGVDIDILKLGNANWSDDEINYAFRAARAVSARGISFEISNEAAERMAPFATQHDMLVGMHNHTQVASEDFSFDIPLSFGPNNMLNLDIGHYVAGLSISPIPVIRKYHDRITHLHLKDRKSAEHGGDNVPWGEGDTPIGEVLRLLRDESYPITAMIELEYEIPEGSSVLQEMEKCVAFCNEALS